MGSATVQGELWGAKPADWAELCEPVSEPAFDAVFDRAGVGRGTRLLDVGCGTGGALLSARARGAEVAGMDASEALVAFARPRLPGVRLEVGDMEALPFENDAFDVVTGFNSFQFAADIPAALAEAARVCRRGGHVAMTVWGPPEECESVTHTFSKVMALLPPPPPSPRPPLGTPGVMEELLTGAGLEPVAREAVDIPFDYPDAATAWRGMSAAGIMVNAIRQLGEETAKRVAMESLVPFTRPDGRVVQRNRFHWVLAKKR